MQLYHFAILQSCSCVILQFCNCRELIRRTWGSAFQLDMVKGKLVFVVGTFDNEDLQSKVVFLIMWRWSSKLWSKLCSN